MISKACPKAGIYFSHYECLGHTSRVMAVGEVFKKRFPAGNLFFIQAGLEQATAQTGCLGRLYTLPGAFMDRRHFREPIQQAGADTHRRSQMCADIVTQEKPDLLMTEFFPLGRDECRHELIAPLVKASKQGAAVWGIAGYPLLTGTDPQWRETILKLYQKIVIFSPPEEKQCMVDAISDKDERTRYLEFFERNASKITFAGYLLPQQAVVSDDVDGNHPRPPVPPGACQVAVVRGGGAYHPKLIADAILASDVLGKEYYLTIVAGPSTTAKEWYLFSSLASKKKINNVLLLRAVADYEGVISRSDVCVSTGSYHSSVMLLKHRKKAVIVPFEGEAPVSFHEQAARARLLKETIGAGILPIQELTAETLAARIKEAADSKPAQRIPEDWFMGENVLSKALDVIAQ
jgi:predicted glycosyltransferase